MYNGYMAIITIKALPQDPKVKMHNVLKILCGEVAETLGRLPKGIWATFEKIESGNYVEGDSAVKVQPKSTHPPLALVTAMEGMSDLEKENVMKTVNDVLVREFFLSPGNVHIEFNEVRGGHIFSAGKMQYGLR